jgi:hypothetical protein
MRFVKSLSILDALSGLLNTNGAGPAGSIGIVGIVGCATALATFLIIALIRDPIII